jgi:ribonuclease P protein component
VFPRPKRLNRAALSLALAAGRRVSSPHFSAVVPRGVAGYAVIVPKKVARLSATRHRIKRRVREALRAQRELPPGLILFPKAAVAEMTYAEVSGELTALLSKIRG